MSMKSSNFSWLEICTVFNWQQEVFALKDCPQIFLQPAPEEKVVGVQFKSFSVGVVVIAKIGGKSSITHPAYFL